MYEIQKRTSGIEVFFYLKCLVLAWNVRMDETVLLLARKWAEREGDNWSNGSLQTSALVGGGEIAVESQGESK